MSPTSWLLIWKYLFHLCSVLLNILQIFKVSFSYLISLLLLRCTLTQQTTHPHRSDYVYPTIAHMHHKWLWPEYICPESLIPTPYTASTYRHTHVCTHEVMCKVWIPMFQKYSSLAQYRFRCLKDHQVPACWQTCKRKITDCIPIHLGQLQQDREIKSIFSQQRSSSRSETPKYNCILFSNILLQRPTAPIHRAACQQCNHT